MLPLFPLQTVLFPGGLLDLQIFEVRYLDMIGRCHKENRPFGVVSLSRGKEVRKGPESDNAPEVFHTVGTLAHIETLERVQAGLMRVRCVGGSRFRLTHHELLKHGLWVGQTEALLNDPAVAVPQDLAHVALAMRQLIQRIEAQGLAGHESPLKPPYAVEDCSWLSNRWCELLPISSAIKQQLMVLESPLLRLELVADLLGDLKERTLPSQ